MTTLAEAPAPPLDPPPAEPRRLILRSDLSPGDILMMTAAVRDLHATYPGRFLTDVRTHSGDLWEHNPHITPIADDDPRAESIAMEYPMINRSNDTALHFIHGYHEHLAGRLGLPLTVGRFGGDIHLSGEERGWLSQVEETGYHGPFWIIMAGGKYDFTAKWWDPARYQRVVDHFRGRLLFVQCGERAHWHPRLRGVLDLVGRTTARQFIRLMHHADGVVCPVTFAMHLAAAVPRRPDKPRNRAAVVIAGGREPMQWEAYPHHQFIATNGALGCCEHGGCWRSRCQPLRDGDDKDDELCEAPVRLDPDLVIPRCMDLIRAEDVIRRIEFYYEGGALRYADQCPLPSRRLVPGFVPVADVVPL